MLDRVATVSLLTGTRAEFPDECVGCGEASPGRSAWLITRDARYHVVFWAGWLSLRVPACRACSRRLHLWRWWTFVRTLLIALAGMAVGVVVLLPRLSGFLTGLVVLVLISAAFLAVFFLDRRFPPSFNVDKRGATTDYEFRSRSYAERFAALNGGSVL